MRFVVRSDLGGYAGAKDELLALADVEIERPFVLLTGPNGAGKSALLRMIRASIGLGGERAGHLGTEFSRPVEKDEASDDLGKLAAYVHGFDGPKAPRDFPGVLDVRQLGWTGQRTWLFDSRAETNLVAASSFGADMMHQVAMVVGGAARVSHGQLLRRSWGDALHWALGYDPGRDPYDSSHVPDGRKALLDALAPAGRSEERWLFLDEVEVALDIEQLVVGLSLLLETAEIGKLRVFCASHSPLFAAGMADHWSVQVVDLGGPKPWLVAQKAAMTIASSPSEISRIAGVVTKNINEQQASIARKAAADRQKAVTQAISRLSRPATALLLELADAGGAVTFSRKSLPSFSVIDTLERRELIKRSGFSSEYTLSLTAIGKAGAERIIAKAEVAPEASKPRR